MKRFYSLTAKRAGCVAVILAMLLLTTASAARSIQDDFSGGGANWSLSRMTIAAGRLNAPGSGVATATLLGDYTGWRDFETELVFCQQSQTSQNFMSVRVRAASASDKTMIILRSGAINFVRGSELESRLRLYTLQKDVEYRLRLRTVGTNLFVFIREEGGGPFEFAGVIPGISESAGSLVIGSSAMQFTVDDFSLTEIEPADLSLVQNTEMTVGGKYRLFPGGDTAGGYTFTSADPDVVRVYADGAVVANRAGSCALIASKGGSWVQYTVLVSSPPLGVHLNKTAMELYVGESENLSAAVLPQENTAAQIEWSVAGGGVISLIGEARDARGVKAVGEGTAVVRAQLSHTPYAAECVVTVTRKPEEEALTAVFEADGDGREIPPYLFGIHSNAGGMLVGNVQTSQELNPQYVTDAIRETGFRSVRGGGEEYIYQNGSVIGRTIPPGYARYYMRDFYEKSQDLAIPQVLAVSMRSTDAEIITQIRMAMELTDQPIFIELGNEIYAMANSAHVPDIGAYIQRCGDLYPQIKALDPSIKVGVSAVDSVLDAIIQANAAMQPDADPGSTTVARAKEWNRTIAENPDCYDAVVVHEYTAISTFDGMNQRGMMEYFFSYEAMTAQNHAQYNTVFPGKEIWITEYGDLPPFFWMSDQKERARLQYMKSVGNAVGYANRFFGMLQSGNVTLSHYHYLEDPQGFGLVQKQGAGIVRLPNYHVFQKIGALLGEYQTFYPMRMKSGPAKQVEMKHIGGIKKTVPMDGVSMWGLGSPGGLRRAVLINKTEQPVTVSLEGGVYLQKIWEYGGGDPIPDLAAGTAATWLDAPAVIPLPDETEGDAAQSVTLLPYSMMVVRAIPVGISAVTVQDADTGEDITQRGIANGRLLVSFDAFAGGEAAPWAYAAAGVYSQSRLEGLALSPPGSLSTGQATPCRVLLEVSGDGDKEIRLFLWAGVQSARPIARTVKFGGNGVQYE